VFQGTKLALTVWFLAIYLISQAKTGLSALALKRHLGVGYPTAWLIHHKVMQAMAAREAHYVLAGQVQVDAAYLGGERSGGKAGRGSENKIPFVATISLSDDGHPLRPKLSPLPGFTLQAIAHHETRDAPSRFFRSPTGASRIACRIRGFTPHLCRALSLALCPVPASVRRLDRGGRPCLVVRRLSPATLAPAAHAAGLRPGVVTAAFGPPFLTSGRAA